jgi:hypothetical protein
MRGPSLRALDNSLPALPTSELRSRQQALLTVAPQLFNRICAEEQVGKVSEETTT